jgi:probable phosphoglycerate mutase
MRADQAVAYALDHMVDRDVVFVGHGHFSRAVVTRWVEQPLREAPGTGSARHRWRCAASSTGCVSCPGWG